VDEFNKGFELGQHVSMDDKSSNNWWPWGTWVSLSMVVAKWLVS
jgi:hypothetical protein